jgi:hypothetical protein
MKPRLVAGIIAAVFLVLCFRLVDRDFYYDELLTLKKAVYVPVSAVMTEYSSLNTHPLHALINNLAVKVSWNLTFERLLNAPDVLRVLQLVFPALTLGFLFLIGTRLRDEWTGALAVLIMATTLPFYYYSVLLRGYELSMALFAGMVYFSLRKWYAAVGITTALFLYVMPSNAVFVAAVAVMAWKDWKMLAALGCGCAFAGILYCPLIPGILADPQTGAHDSRLRNLTESIPETINAFISYRWLMIPVAAWGLWKVKPKFALWAPGVTVISFAAFIVSGGYLWARVLMPLFVIWTMTVALGIRGVIKL